MKIQKNGVSITACDMCHEPLNFHRAAGLESYEGYGFSVCSNCCASPDLTNQRENKVDFLTRYYHSSHKLHDGVPPFWPTDSNGKPLTITAIKSLLIP